MRTMKAIFALLGLVVAVPAVAVSVQNPADLLNGNSLVAPGAYSGVVGIRVQSNLGAAAACTGTLIGVNTVLTAAHCLTLDASGVYKTQIVFGDFQTIPGTTTLASPTVAGGAFFIDPGWTGSVAGGSDLAIIKLAGNAPKGTTVYQVDTGSVASDLGVEKMVGLGTVGTGTLGAIGFDGRKRYGYNQYQFTLDQIFAAAGIPARSGTTDYFGAANGSQLAYDFTNGNPLYDVFGRFLGTSSGPGYVTDGGVNYLDTLATAGDSGAPHFENGKVVGVTSFGISGSLFQRSICAVSGSVDPSHSATSCTDSSYGEIGVDTRVASFSKFIGTYVPEPSNWALMITGFGLIGSMARRQRRFA